MSARPPDADGLRYARHWEPVLAPAAHRVLDHFSTAPAVLLDIGAGTGSLTLEAARRWPASQLVAVDHSSAMLSVARTRAGEAGVDPSRITWLTADARDMPLPAATADVAVCSFVLQRVETRSMLLTEVRRVLQPGSRFAFVTWLADELRLEADSAYDAVLAESGHAIDAHGFRAPLANDFRSSEEARTELLEAGFETAETWTEELRARWTPHAFLRFKECYDDRDRFEALDDDARRDLRERLGARLATLPRAAFELRSPLVAGIAQRP